MVSISSIERGINLQFEIADKLDGQYLISIACPYIPNLPVAMFYSIHLCHVFSSSGHFQMGNRLFY